MSDPRKRFCAALGLFLIWVGVLAALAVTSARTPRGAGTDPASGAVEH